MQIHQKETHKICISTLRSCPVPSSFHIPFAIFSATYKIGIDPIFTDEETEVQGDLSRQLPFVQSCNGATEICTGIPWHLYSSIMLPNSHCTMLLIQLNSTSYICCHFYAYYLGSVSQSPVCGADKDTMTILNLQVGKLRAQEATRWQIPRSCINVNRNRIQVSMMVGSFQVHPPKPGPSHPRCVIPFVHRRHRHLILMFGSAQSWWWQFYRLQRPSTTLPVPSECLH